MRVCLVAHRFYDDNAHMMQFANALARRGDYVDVISLRRPDRAKEEVIDGVHVSRVKARVVNETGPFTYITKIVAFVVQAAIVMAARHLRRPYDVIHVQSVPDFLVLAALFPKILGARIILDLRDLVPELYVAKFGISRRSVIFKMLVWVERLSAALADGVLVANPIWLERVVSRSTSREKCSMIWYHPDRSLFRPRTTDNKRNGFVVCYPGTLNWHQGVDLAVKAFPKVLKAVPCAEFHIYGEGSARERIISLIEELRLNGAVKVRDTLPLNRIAGIMAECDVGIVPKRISTGFGDEAASTKIPEFLALGVPVVASRTKVETVFFDDSVVRYFTAEDIDDLSSAIIDVCLNSELRKRLIENGLRQLAKVEWDFSMPAYRDLVDRLAQHKRSSTERRYA